MKATKLKLSKKMLKELQPTVDKCNNIVCPFTPSIAEKLPLDKLFSEREIREKREKIKSVARNFMDKWYKARYGDEF